MNGKVIITNYKDKICSFLIQNNRLIEVHTLESYSKVGSIYVGKVKNVLQNIQAYFVEIADKEVCFLPFAETNTAFCLNRTVNERLVQGDEIPVQITKDALKTKQASVTCNLSKAGDNFVFTVGNDTLGISNKLSKPVKAALRETLQNAGYMDESCKLVYHSKSSVPTFGAIIRTEAASLYEKSPAEFLALFESEMQEFLTLLETSRYKTCFQCIYKPYLSFLGLLDTYAENEYSEVVTDLNEAYTALQDFSKPVRFYEDANYPLMKLYSLETKVQEAFHKQVWLKSGANIIIEATECLTTIDVNSAKQIKKSTTQRDILEINKEAAVEAALQIRLRNMSGIIIIDFINMEDFESQQELLQLMKDLVCKDKILTKVIDITPLGLMEITRKKINKPLSEQLRG